MKRHNDSWQLSSKDRLQLGMRRASISSEEVTSAFWAKRSNLQRPKAALIRLAVEVALYEAAVPDGTAPNHEYEIPKNIELSHGFLRNNQLHCSPEVAELLGSCGSVIAVEHLGSGGMHDLWRRLDELSPKSDKSGTGYVTPPTLMRGLAQMSGEYIESHEETEFNKAKHAVGLLGCAAGVFLAHEVESWLSNQPIEDL